jgi:predicted HAD superfamily Cof-like phosphohydrolase
MEDAKQLAFRFKLMSEELSEIGEAMIKGDAVGVLDGLVDLDYFIKGTAVEMGWDFEEAFRRVHDSNMAKMPSDGYAVYRDDGKLIKPKGWQPPCLDDLV